MTNYLLINRPFRHRWYVVVHLASYVCLCCTSFDNGSSEVIILRINLFLDSPYIYYESCHNQNSILYILFTLGLHILTCEYTIWVLHAIILVLSGLYIDCIKTFFFFFLLNGIDNKPRLYYKLYKT